MATELIRPRAPFLQSSIYTIGAGRAVGADLEPSGTSELAESGAGFWASLGQVGHFLTQMHGATGSSVPPLFAGHLGPLADKSQLWSYGTGTQGFVRPRGRFWEATETSVGPTHWQVGLAGT